MMAVTDSHPLPRFRANGPVSNLPEFAAAFSCPAGAAMARSAKRAANLVARLQLQVLAAQQKADPSRSDGLGMTTNLLGLLDDDAEEFLLSSL